MDPHLLKVMIAAAVIGAIIAIIIRLKGGRRKALDKVAALASVYVEEYGPDVPLLESTGLPFFVDGSGGFGQLLLRFPNDAGATSYYFDYSCLLGGGEEQHKRHSTVALFVFEQAVFPDFHLSAAGDPIEITGLEPADMAAFDKLPPGVKLYGRDLAALKAYLNTEKEVCFGEHPGWSAQGSKNSLVLYKGSSLIKPDEYAEFMAEAKKLAFNLL